jgi:simple sugar transport system permease protein
LVTRLRPLARIAAAVAGTVALMSVLISVLGANPLDAYAAMLQGVFGSPYGFGQTLTVAASLILTGLAAALPFSARLWNIGAEGQLYFGAVGCVSVALSIADHVSAPLVVIVGILMGALAGGLWGLIAGVLKAAFGISEVIVTLMLNFLAVLASNYTIDAFKGGGVQAATRPLPDPDTLPVIWFDGGVNAGLLLALAVAVIAYLVLYMTPFGLSIRAAGANPRAARLAGFRLSRTTIYVFGLGGACAGLAGAALVLGINHSLVYNMSSDYGLIGVAVALAARLHPLWIVPVAWVFAAITVGGSNLTAGAGISTSASLIVVALLPVMLLATGVIKLRYPQVTA